MRHRPTKSQKPLWAMGTMSGTSLDGVDAALVKTNGVEILAFGETGFRPYNETEQAVLRSGLGLWHDAPEVQNIAQLVEKAHIALLKTMPQAELIGFHGQTLAHAPQESRTHQAGSGARLAQELGVQTVWDFRSADVALGGEGAPLAPAFHHAALSFANINMPACVLNLGGVGNLTYVDPRLPMEDPKALLAFDTGPANAPINDVMAHAGLGSFDAEGAYAAQGTVVQPLVDQVLETSFFARIPPKSLDRDSFQQALLSIMALPVPDAAATLTSLVAQTVRQGMTHLPHQPQALYVTGGGRKNPVIMQALQEHLSCKVMAIEEIGLDGDMLEAQAFAYLAVRVLYGLPTSFPTTTGVAAQVGGGIVSDIA